MKRFFSYVLVLSIFSLACQTLMGPNISPESPIAIPTLETQEPLSTDNTEPTSVPIADSYLIPDMQARLDELGGTPCKNAASFTCVTITVPLDHFDSANPETIEVVFAVATARGERKGMYVQAFPGGPGGEGISYASTGYFSSSVLASYDVVFFDQRGLGVSNPLECKTAYANYFLGFINSDDSIGEEGYDTPAEQQDATQKAESFVQKCIDEIGIDPAKLKFFNTDQVAEDIEAFRQAIGDDKFMLYGVSYGTSVAQTYTRVHADRLLGLILDGTQDTTLSGNEIAFSQMEAFNVVLYEVFKACDANDGCSKGMPNGSQAAYDELAQKLADAPIAFEYPVTSQRKEKHFFTFNMLDFTVSYQMYAQSSRFDLMRAIADAKTGNMIPLAKLFYENAHIDPASGEYMGSPDFSDTLYYIVWCSDDAYYSGTSEERSAQLFQEGQKLVGLIPRLDLDVFVLGLTCAYWPSAPTNPKAVEPLKAEGVPTFVLNATLDPATPFHEAKTVYENLDNGYLLYVEGGPHGILGWGYSCPDFIIDDFLVNGILPDQRETRCDWGNAIIQ